MANISKKTAYDIKEASNPSLSKSARWHYQENAQAATKADGMAMCGPKHGPAMKKGCGGPAMVGSWMSKHCNCK